MGKVFQTLRSMRFGILLLCLIAACSVAGTLIPQDREIAWYAQNYPSLHGTILTLQLNRVFDSWYFKTLLVLLCLNLSLCSLVRIRGVVRAAKSETARAAEMKDAVLLTPEGVEKLRARLEEMRCRREDLGGASVYRKNLLGHYGTFITHLSILLTVVFGALALYTPTVTDQSCMPGESIFLPDGTEIHVLDFRITDETGRLDYQSRVQITLPDGRRSGEAELRVNHPFSFGPCKLFQQTFGTAGSVTVTNLENGGTDNFLLTEQAFLSADGVNGILYEMLYPDFLRDPSGNVTLITITEGSYPNPIYRFEVIADGDFTPTLAEPGEVLELKGLRFAFNKPVEYPGLRIKHVSTVFNALLIASFTMMIAGLCITFFFEPVLVRTDAEGYAVGGPKPERMRIELGEEFRAYERKNEEETT
ncbi:MAG: cytochrome c biogenesis protein ResB [Oscillospiraceae bacterium]|nr:cytochrome c biogenesis protein ResB [Oscillospiraceae bacterium]